MQAILAGTQKAGTAGGETQAITATQDYKARRLGNQLNEVLRWRAPR